MSAAEIAGRYRLEHRLGFGGMSTVQLAFDERLERQVAVKLLAEHLAEDPAFVSRFQREAQAAARLIHPNIVQVFDSGRDERTAQYFIVMEYIEGSSCAEILREHGWVEVEEALSVIEQACEGLDYAHRHGVVHRDVKPGNLLRALEGEVKLADFGIAKATEQSSITQVGAVLGTAAYLAPEQARGEEAGPSADLYALGVVTYQLISGRLPYEASSLTELALKQQNEQPAPLDTLVAAVTPELGQAVAGALALDPSERYASAREMRRALQDGARGIAPSAPTRVGPHACHERRAAAQHQQPASAPAAPAATRPSARAGTACPVGARRQGARGTAPRADAARAACDRGRGRRGRARQRTCSHAAGAARSRVLDRAEKRRRAESARLRKHAVAPGAQGRPRGALSAMLRIQMLSAIINVTHLVETSGYPLLFVLVMCESGGVPIPGETALIAAAVAASQGTLAIEAVIPLAAAAAIVGDNIGYLIGRKGGRWLLERPGAFHRQRLEVLARGEPFFERHGPKAVFFGRFVLGLRVWASWLAGATRMHWRSFVLWNALGGISLGQRRRHRRLRLGHSAGGAFEAFGLYGLIGVVLAVAGRAVLAPPPSPGPSPCRPRAGGCEAQRPA